MKAKVGLFAVAVLLSGAACSGSADDDAEDTTTTTAVPATAIEPSPPQLPDDFTWTGRYLVPDLDVEVPFTWNASEGDMQMIAGGEDQPIHFTNVIHDGALYTLTYEWPNIPRMPCSPIGPYTLDDLNAGLAEASFVGAEILEELEPRSVFHYRSASAIEVPPEVLGLPEDAPVARVPIMSGDIYVDREDPSVIWKLLHFGVQNLYDVDLDEWIVIDEVSDAPGEVTLPQECADEAAAAATPEP
ncbi:MAG: hypothetical protein ABI239_11495 [Aquihabitans sp.]